MDKTGIGREGEEDGEGEKGEEVEAGDAEAGDAEAAIAADRTKDVDSGGTDEGRAVCCFLRGGGALVPLRRRLAGLLGIKESLSSFSTVLLSRCLTSRSFLSRRQERAWALKSSSGMGARQVLQVRTRKSMNNKK
jgi:hypothetical protein